MRSAQERVFNRLRSQALKLLVTFRRLNSPFERHQLAACRTGLACMLHMTTMMVDGF